MSISLRREWSSIPIPKFVHPECTAMTNQIPCYASYSVLMFASPSCVAARANSPGRFVGRACAISAFRVAEVVLIHATEANLAWSYGKHEYSWLRPR
jgi:hypothetical protein